MLGCAQKRVDPHAASSLSNAAAIGARRRAPIFCTRKARAFFLLCRLLVGRPRATSRVIISLVVERHRAARPQNGNALARRLAVAKRRLTTRAGKTRLARPSIWRRRTMATLRVSRASAAYLVEIRHIERPSATSARARFALLARRHSPPPTAD